MGSQLNIDLGDEFKVTLKKVCKKRRLNMKDVVMALLDGWVVIDDEYSIMMVLEYKKRQCMKDIKELGKRICHEKL